MQTIVTKMNAPLQKPKAIFFDWDGTLVDSYNLLYNAHAHVLESLNLPVISHENFKHYFGKPRDYVYKTFYANKEDEARILFERYLKEHQQDITVCPGADTLLENISARGIKMGVVTNKLGKLVQHEIDHLKWNQYFQTVVGSGDATADKPSGAPLIMACEKMGLLPNSTDIWYVGDTETDLKCAQEAGCFMIFIKGIDEADELIRAYRPDLVFNNCKALSDFFSCNIVSFR